MTQYIFSIAIVSAMLTVVAFMGYFLKRDECIKRKYRMATWIFFTLTIIGFVAGYIFR
jgi:hypothetical protein